MKSGAKPREHGLDHFRRAETEDDLVCAGLPTVGSPAGTQAGNEVRFRGGVFTPTAIAVLSNRHTAGYAT